MLPSGNKPEVKPFANEESAQYLVNELTGLSSSASAADIQNVVSRAQAYDDFMTQRKAREVKEREPSAAVVAHQKIDEAEAEFRRITHLKPWERREGHAMTEEAAQAKVYAAREEFMKLAREERTAAWQAKWDDLKARQSLPKTREEFLKLQSEETALRNEKANWRHISW